MPQQIAFLGLGRMGFGMASRLLDRGHGLKVWNRTAAKAEPLAARGARVARTPREAADGADAILSMVADDPASEAVWLGPDGALAGARPGALAAEHSTLTHGHLMRIAEACRDHGLTFIDSPVTGYPDQAARGELQLLVGADTHDLERAGPLLADLSVAVHRFGPVGAGTAYKLMINLMGAVQLAALAEGLALAEKMGLDREAVIGAIETSAAGSRQVVRFCRPMATRTYAKEPTFTLGLRHKDAAYGVALAEAAGMSSALGREATRIYEAARHLDLDGDEARVMDYVTQKAK